MRLDELKWTRPEGRAMAEIWHSDEDCIRIFRIEGGYCLFDNAKTAVKHTYYLEDALTAQCVLNHLLEQYKVT